MKKIYGIVLLFACLLFAGCNKAIVVTDDALSGAVMTGEVEVTGMIETGVVDTMTGIQDSMTGVVMLQGVGTEPFWAFTMTGDALVRSAPDVSGVVDVLYTGVDQIINSGTTIIYSNLSATVNLQVTPGSCSDGMSDIVYPAAVLAMINAQTYQGCIR